MSKSMVWASVMVCERCWGKLQGDRKPVKLKDAAEVPCHLCLKPTRSGIFVRMQVKEKKHGA